MGDGVEHVATTTIQIKNWNDTLYSVGETVTGSSTGVTAVVAEAMSADADAFGYHYIKLKELTNNGNTYKFTTADTLNGQSSGATGEFVKQEYTNLVRTEPE